MSHGHKTNAQSNLPESGKQIAAKANRAGVAERCDEAAVPKTLEVDLALLTSYEARLKARDLSIRKTAKHHAAHPVSLLQTVPGMGKGLSRVWLSAIHRLARLPSVQDFAS